MALQLIDTTTGGTTGGSVTDNTNIAGSAMQIPSTTSPATGQPTGTSTFAPFGTDPFGNPVVLASSNPDSNGGTQPLALTPGSQFLQSNPQQYASDTSQFGILANFFGPFVRAGNQLGSSPNTPGPLITGSSGDVNYSVGIDEQLNVKQNYFGTPEYFRNILRGSSNPAENYVLGQGGLPGTPGGIAQGLFASASQGAVNEATQVANTFLSLGQATRNVDLQSQALSFLNYGRNGATSSPEYASVNQNDPLNFAGGVTPGQEYINRLNPAYRSAEQNLNLGVAYGQPTVSQSPVFPLLPGQSTTQYNSDYGALEYSNGIYGNAIPAFLPGETQNPDLSGSFSSPAFHIGPAYNSMNYPSTSFVRF